ncbi:hypothetical protein GQ53DRAFT_869633 [Thozetella sp. PMI_491]|nr:hypothetical protein GQ53DRAFT_869633 [Thozetella sp. PMI_491]
MQTFQLNNTLPSAGVNFVSSPYIRVSLDIVRSCASVLLLCAWSALHLNVSLQSTPGTFRQKYKRTAWTLVRKIKWMLINLLAPELPLGKAWSDRKSVKFVAEKFETWSKKDGIP